jgi:hypothetical protein
LDTLEHVWIAEKSSYNLQFDSLSIKFNSSDFLCLRQLVILLVPNIATYEIDTDGRDVGLSVGIIGKSQQQARLSNTRVSNKQELEEVVVSESRCQYLGPGQPAASTRAREGLGGKDSVTC